MNCTLIKLGGGLITDKSRPLTLRQEVLAQISQEIGQLHKNYSDSHLIIGNGAGSFGHYTVHKVNYRARRADNEAIDAVRQSVITLNQSVVKALETAGVPAVSLAPSTFISQDQDKTTCDVEPLLKLLSQGKVPVVYGDVIDHKQEGSRIISTEEAFDLIARELVKKDHQINNLIFATSVSGVLDKNGKTISRLDKNNNLSSVKAAGGFDVTGGMAQKVKAGFEALEYTKNVYIINGTKPGELKRAIELKSAGTQFG